MSLAKLNNPTYFQNRVALLDILRGFAITGILYTNILFFSGYEFMPSSQLSRFPSYETTLFAAIDFIFISKFYTLFATLFGVGFYILMQKYSNKLEFANVYKRRMFVLLLIGIIHSLLIWNGDILMLYALLGFILLTLKSSKIKPLLKISFFLLTFFVLIDIVLILFIPAQASVKTIAADPAHIDYPDMTGDQVLQSFQSNNFLDFFKINLHNLIWKWIAYIPTLRPLTVLGLFILGYYLAAKSFFEKAIYNLTLLITSLVVGVFSAIISNNLGGSFFQFPPTLSNTIYKLLDLISQIGLCLFYITAIAQICKKDTGLKLFSLLIPAGKMTLTCYLLQSIFSVLIFKCTGLYGKLSLSQDMFIATGINLGIIFIAHFWIAKYKTGPVEKLWRQFYYRKKVV